MTGPGIREVAELCGRMQAANVELFRTLGDWVTSTADAAEQRTYAMATHRHAWHAALWAGRDPAVPGLGGADVDAPATEQLTDVADADRAEAYGTTVDALIDDLRSVRSRIDPLLDPSTLRVIELVTTDLESIRARL